MATLNHVTAATGTYAPTQCEDCHSIAGVTYAGVKPTTTTGLCDKCHAASANVLARFASGIHTLAVKPAFTWSADATTAFKINLNAASSTNCTSYTWDLGGGTGTTTGVTTSATYTSSNAATVTLTCGSVSVSKTVNPARLAKPLLVPNGVVAVSGYVATVSDQTTTAPGTGNGTVRIQWGDGKSSVISRNTSTTHTYAAARTYSIRMTITDTGATGVPGQLVGQSLSAVIGKLTITGVVSHPTGSNVPLQGVTVTLRVGSKILKKAITKADGSYTILNVVPYASLPASVQGLDTQYTVEASKRIKGGKTPVYFTWDAPAQLHPDAGATNVNFTAVE
jgi:hypothetical protein